MATQAFYDWVHAGRPFLVCAPGRDYLVAFERAGWPVASLGTIGDTAHLTADRPQDHCPFSVTGWPAGNPYPYVLAFDAGHDPASGRDMGPIVDRWLSEARAGRTPWVKYIVWRGQLYDVRNGWKPVAASDHFDHAHVSFRTDWYNKSIGSWSPIGKDDDMFCAYGDGNSGAPSDKVKAYQELLLVVDPNCLPHFRADGGFGDETAAAGAKILGGDGRTYGPVQYAALFAKIGAIGSTPGKDGKDGKDAPVPKGIKFPEPLVGGLVYTFDAPTA